MDMDDIMNKGILNRPAATSVPADFTSPEQLYQKLIDKIISYHPSADISMIEKAYNLAITAHCAPIVCCKHYC